MVIQSPFIGILGSCHTQLPILLDEFLPLLLHQLLSSTGPDPSSVPPSTLLASGRLSPGIWPFPRFSLSLTNFRAVPSNERTSSEVLISNKLSRPEPLLIFQKILFFLCAAGLVVRTRIAIT
jgi:hypothetical protein